ncbi:hypothetical protein FXO38_12802 [Capsicum annuum]|nr:hypothetical protein FXO38_12802 [Capsicum annuum]
MAEQPLWYEVDDDDDMDEAGATSVIIPPPLAPGEKFNIISTMIQLLNLKGLFGGVLEDDPNLHLVNFLTICNSFDNLGLPNEALNETWERFKKKLTQCLNHSMMNIHLMETLYRAFNSVIKPIVDNTAGASFFALSFKDAADILNRMTKLSRAWYTNDFVVASPTIPIRINDEQNRRDKEKD